MAKKTAQKSSEQEIDEEQEYTLSVCESLATAIRIAKDIFGEAGTLPETIFGVFDRLDMDAEGEDEQAEDLIKALDVSKELFGTQLPTQTMVFGMFDRLFLEEPQ